MEGWVAVTHSDWIDFLAQQPRREEVNFWSPSDYYAFHGTPGAPFFFKLKAPRNAIGGFGYVASFTRLPEWLAWECFGEGNGASSFEEFKARLDTLRDHNALRGADGLSQIGCIVLVQAVLFPPEQWVPQPADWGRQNLRYKRYDLTVGEGARVWRECQERVASMAPLQDAVVVHEERERYGAAVLVRPRLGQGSWTTMYSRH